MKKSLIALVVATSISALSVAAAPVDKDGRYLNTAKDLIGSLSYQDKQEYIAQFNTLETQQEKAAFFKMVIVAETSVENAVNFVLDRVEAGEGTLADMGLTGTDVEAYMVESGLLTEGRNGNLVIDDTSDAYKAMKARRSEAWTKHVQYSDDDPFYISPIVDDNERDIPTPAPISTDLKVSGFNKAMEKAGNSAMIQKDPITGEYTLYREGQAPLALTNEEAVKNAMRVVALTNTDGYEKVLQEIHDRQEVIVDPVDVVITPIDPGFGVDPKPGNPTPHPGYSTDVKVSAFNKAMERKGSEVQISKTVDAVTGEATYHFIQDGSAPIELTPENADKFKKALAKATNDHRSAKIDPIDPGFGGDPDKSPKDTGIDKILNEFAAVNSSIQVVANSAANNSLLIADVAATQSASNVALQEASQTLQAKTGKAVQVLETARNGMQSGVNELHIAAGSMKTSLTAELADLQAQIDRLNSGDDGTNPPTVDEELRAGLVVAKDKVETELVAVNKSVDIVANSAANNSTLIATNSANQAATNDALKSAGQELQAKTGKAVETLETARSGMNAGANELMAALQAMQAQMDAQARLIAELQAGENPGTGLPTGIDEEVRDGLQTASATMQKKLGTAADTLKAASKGLKNNKPQNGVQPIQPIQPTDPVEPVTPLDPREHEYGSVGNGAATAWLNERIDSGKGLMNEHLDAEFTAFEDKITAMYQSDMASFQEDVQDEMDGVMASTHAITNSRPFLSNGGTAVGVGIGAAGDASAVAIGVAHSFKDTGWSVSGSVNATTGSSSDVSLGAGVQFQF
ncbi:YadA C-terminal domain-containing protein [Shewanella woodyi]|uniref:Trimeric autotransporter adhesin YadA-like C-terminal membrane anchor domain-containing protein n=1 Tax=Shewanella woodyi (strain ATCC 51908 / MS32) TaxID=392500 RepID=B1KR58_SHEWM|nr:YadA C-terminal domain-containing protein [Shewanella woodyi]ACA84875.1 hypothetical protein Swoo_0579 [Shewanella woodyi ATCC 51908]